MNMHEEGVAVVSVSGDEAFATKYSLEAFADWYEKTYEMECTKEQFFKECYLVDLDQDGVFVNSNEVGMSAAEIELYKTTHENCEFYDWNNRKLGQWIECEENTLIFMSYREIIKRTIGDRGYIQPFMLMSVYA